MKHDEEGNAMPHIFSLTLKYMDICSTSRYLLYVTSTHVPNSNSVDLSETSLKTAIKLISNGTFSAGRFTACGGKISSSSSSSIGGGKSAPKIGETISWHMVTMPSEQQQIVGPVVCYISILCCLVKNKSLRFLAI